MEDGNEENQEVSHHTTAEIETEHSRTERSGADVSEANTQLHSDSLGVDEPDTTTAAAEGSRVPSSSILQTETDTDETPAVTNEPGAPALVSSNLQHNAVVRSSSSTASCAKRMFARMFHKRTPTSKELQRQGSAALYSRSSTHGQGSRKLRVDTWMNLDGATWEHILLYLPFHDIVSTRRVNRTLRSIAKRRSLWAYLLDRDFGTEIPGKDNIPVLPRTASAFQQLRQVPANRVTDMECDISVHFELTYKKYLINSNTKRRKAYNARKNLRRRTRLYICCTICRCIADFMHFICFPCATGSFGLTTLILLGVKLNDSAAFGWWAVLFPMQFTIALIFVSFVKVALCHSLDPNDPVANRYAEIETESTPCGQCLDNINYDQRRSSATLTWSIFSFAASFFSLVIFVILLSLKLENGLDVLWSSVLVPLEIGILGLPASGYIAVDANNLENSFKLIGVTYFFLFLPSTLTILLFGLRVDGLASLAMWEVLMPVLLSLGIMWIVAIIGVILAVRESNEEADLSRWQLVGYTVLGFFLATVVLGIIGAQSILFIIRGDTHELDDTGYLKLFIPMLIHLAVFCLLVWIAGVAYYIDFVDSNDYFSNGYCKYLTRHTVVGRIIRDDNELLDYIV